MDCNNRTEYLQTIENDLIRYKKQLRYFKDLPDAIDHSGEIHSLEKVVIALQYFYDQFSYSSGESK